MLRATVWAQGYGTGIEAVGNAMPILREPRVETSEKYNAPIWRSPLHL